MCSLAGFVLVAATAADEPDPRLRRLIDDSISWYELFSPAGGQPMKPAVALRWDNNTRGSAHGATVIWLSRGRPEAVAAIYEEGGNSVNGDGSVRTLAGFATAADRLHGLDEYYGSPTPLDDWVRSALDGTGVFAEASDGVRAQVSAEIDFARVERSQETFNPDLPALRSEHVREESSSSPQPGGVPGALSNQPPPPGGTSFRWDDMN